ncbi:MAG: chorismate synthase [Anaerolineales bacterium]|nr:chorismate synthase [Chloroflexota bacterium]MBL6980464.1 chorismate synthase [Anaerolineales bacterium]
MFTTRLRYLTAGESHGPNLTAILEGIPAGLKLGIEQLNHELARRQRGYGAGPRMKLERDQVEITSGLMAGVTIGSPIALQINNLNHERWRGKDIEPFTTPRPGHADLTAAIKYGYRDLRPSLERASARETAARVAVGAICKQFLEQFDIQIGGYVTEIGGVTADLSEIPLAARFERAEDNDVRCPDPRAAEAIRDCIREAIEAKDTLGGVIETLALNLPIGLGSHVHWDRKLEARLGAAVLGVQAIKGVEFGPAFDNTRLTGTQVHDAIRVQNGTRINTDSTDKIIRENQRASVSKNLFRPTNRAGGIEGGISNGQPLIIRAAMKPIATTLTPQQTVDLATGEQTPTQYERSDFCPVPRAVPIIESVVAFVLADALLEKLGGDSLDEIRPRFETLRQARLDDLTMDNLPQIWWPNE